MRNAERSNGGPSHPGKTAQTAGADGTLAAKNMLAAVPVQPAPHDDQTGFGTPAAPARLKNRHRWLIAGFVAMVLLPVVVSAWYLFAVAKDQYGSRLAFFVRSEEANTALDILGGLTALSGSSGSDTDVLFEFIQSQELVRLIDRRLDLHTIYFAPEDPVFSVDPDSPIEELVKYWNRMVKVYYDSGSGLIEIRVVAFDAAVAVAIAEAIYEESSAMINRLSAIARQDVISYAGADLELAVTRLRVARQAISEFRLRTQILDPAADVIGRMGVLSELQIQLAAARIELNILKQTTHANDPRVSQATRRVGVIEAGIAEERARFSTGQGPENIAYANLVGEFEGLAVDREFAEATYLQTLAAFETARAEALRKTRYLAAYVNPTKAESSQFPQRFVILGILGGFLFGGWAILSLIYYSVRDRR